MSKMGQELERRLDENKYKMYEAICSAIIELEGGSSNHAHFILEQVAIEVEGGAT